MVVVKMSIHLRSISMMAVSPTAARQVDWVRLFQSELVTRRGCSFAVAGVVDAFVFFAQVETPVLVEVAVGGEGAELEDGFGAV